jgi:MFS family permease
MVNLTLIVAGLKELISGELGGTEADASLFFSIEAFAYILFAPFWGMVSDRMGKRRPLVVTGFLLSAVLYAAYTRVESIDLLLMLRFVQGAFTVMGWSVLMARVLDHPDDVRRGRHMGIMGGALSLGVALGVPLGGYVSRFFGARAPLEAAAVLFFLLALGALSVPEATALKRRETLGDIWQTLRSRPELLLPAGFYFVDRYTVGFFVVLFPLYLGSEGITDPALRGRYLALFLLPFALLQYWSGRLTERVGPYWPLFLGSALYGVVLCFVGTASLWALWWIMILLGVLAAAMFPPAILLTARWSDEGTRGSAMGGFNLAGSLGFAVGPMVGIWAYEWRGFGFSFVVAGVLELVVVALGLLWLWKRHGGVREVTS